MMMTMMMTMMILFFIIVTIAIILMVIILQLGDLGKLFSTFWHLHPSERLKTACRELRWQLASQVAAGPDGKYSAVVNPPHIPIFIYLYIYVFIYIYMCVYVHMCMHIYIYI